MPATPLSERLKPVDAGLATTAPEMLQVANAIAFLKSKATA